MVPPRRKLSAIPGTPVAVLHSSRVVAFVACVTFRVALRYIAVPWRIGSLFFGGGGGGWSFNSSLLVPRSRSVGLFRLINFFAGLFAYSNYASLPPVNRVSPFQLEEFQRELVRQPDKIKVHYVLDGIEHGFSSGFDPSRVILQSSLRNMKSAAEHPDVIDAYLSNEVAKGRVAGPFAAPPFPNLQCSPFGVIPKKGPPGKWRLILDLSAQR